MKTPSITPTTRKLPLFNIELAETWLFLPFRKGQHEADTLCFSIDRLVLTPRPSNPLERLVIIESIYQLANEAGLLKSAGSPLEDTQFELEVIGLACATANWSRQLAQRWTTVTDDSSGILTGQNPALEWNRHNFQSKNPTCGSVDPIRPILVPIDVRATWAPALLYKSKPIVASSLEVSLNRDLSLYVALAQVKLVTGWLNSFIQLGQTLFADAGSSGGASGRRKRTQSETTRSKTAQYEYILRHYPFEFVLTGGGNISGMFYDNQITNEQHVIEPYLQFTFEQPSTTFTVTEFDKIKLKLLCYDLSIKSYENHDSPLINTTPFLPLSEHFNVVWIETKYNAYQPRPFITLEIKPEYTELKFERPLKISLDLAKLKIGAKFMRKLRDEFKSSFKPSNSTKTGTTSGDEYFDIIRSVLPQIRVEMVQIVTFVQLYKSAIQFSLESARATCWLEKLIRLTASFGGVRVQLKRNFSKLETVLGPWSGAVEAKMELVAHSTSSRANVAKPKVFLNLSSESLVISASSQLIDKLDCLLGDVSDIMPSSSTSPKLTQSKPTNHSSLITTRNDLHKGVFEFISTPKTENGNMPGVNQVLFETQQKSQLTWRYPERRSISRVAINPVPINRINKSAWPVSIQIELLFFDEVLETFVTLSTLTVSETDPAMVDFSTVDNPAVSDLWQLRIPLYTTDIQPLSPFALAGCCRIDSIQSSKSVSSLAAQISFANVIMRMDNDLELKLSNVSLSAESWAHLVKAQLNSHVKLKIRDHKTLAFVPIMSKALVVAAVNIEPHKKIEFEAVLETCRLTLGQRIIHSLSQIVSKKSKQAFYQVINQTPYHFTIHHHHDVTVKRIQSAPPFETTGVYVISSQLTMTSDDGSPLVIIPGSGQIQSADGITVECRGRFIHVSGGYKLTNLTPFNLAVYTEHAQISLEHNAAKSLVKPIESLSVAVSGFTKTRAIIVELKTHTALELECNDANRVNIGMSVIVNASKQVLIIFSPLFIFRSYYPTVKTLLLPETGSIVLQGKGKEHVVYSLAPHLTHQLSFDANVNISVNLAIISDLIKSPELIEGDADGLNDANHEAEWPLCANDNFVGVKSHMNVRYQPKWGHLPTILVEFLPAMIWINQTGLCLLLSNESEAQMIEPNDSLASASWTHFKLDAKGRDTMFGADKEFDVLDSTSPAWIHSLTHQIPLNGRLDIEFVDGDCRLPIQLSSILSRGIRQIIFTCPLKFANRTKRPLTLTYGPFTVTLDNDTNQSAMALPVKSGENIYIENHKLPFDRSLVCFFVPVAQSPMHISDWLTVTKGNDDVYYVDSMSKSNPPRYTFHNRTNLLLSIEEQSIIMELMPQSTLYYESFQEMALYPGVNQKPVKVRICSEEGAGILHLTPGQWGVKLCQVKLTVSIVEMGRTRTVTIVDSDDNDLTRIVESGARIEGSFKVNRFELVLHDDTYFKRRPVLGLLMLEPYVSVYNDNNADFVVNFVLDELELSNLYRGKRFEYETCLRIDRVADCNRAAPEQSLQSYSDEAILKSPLAVRLKFKGDNQWLRHVEIRCPNGKLWLEDTFLLVFVDLLKNYAQCVVYEDETKTATAPCFAPIYIEYFEINELNVSGMFLFI